MDEFEVIQTFFTRQAVSREDVLLGIGDDAAVLLPPPGRNLVCTTDFLLEDVHFVAGTPARAVGHKALAVNLSDLAAMGACPAWATMTLALRDAAPEWLRDFCGGMFDLARRYRVQLVGGDLTRGPLSVGIHLSGFTGDRGYMTRVGARSGDDVYVSGCIGDAALGLQSRQGNLDLAGPERDAVIRRLDFPQPQVELGKALCGLATAAIDISDGLCADLGHIVAASGASARLHAERLPLSRVYRHHLTELGWGPAVSFGDDYELCFTADPNRRDAIKEVALALGVTVTRVGSIHDGEGVQLFSGNAEVTLRHGGYEHFCA